MNRREKNKLFFRLFGHSSIRFDLISVEGQKYQFVIHEKKKNKNMKRNKQDWKLNIVRVKRCCSVAVIIIIIDFITSRIPVVSVNSGIDVNSTHICATLRYVISFYIYFVIFFPSFGCCFNGQY